MGKIDEALRWAEKEEQFNYNDTSKSVSEKELLEQIPFNPGIDRYEELKINFLARYSKLRVKTVLFVGTTVGDGASTTAINFATALSKDPEINVLLIDADVRTPSLRTVSEANRTGELSNPITDDVYAVYPDSIKQGAFHVLPITKNWSAPLALFQSKAFAQVLTMVSERFDYVILDAPPLQGFSEGLVLSGKVDGVILVIEAGKTRERDAIWAKKRIEEVGGKLLGVVLNKRKFYIPEWIYRRI